MSHTSEVQYRFRIRYAKRGRGAHLSHLEVIHALERTIRRADVPFATTAGFSPHMKVSFGPALAVGVASEDEYFDVILTEYVEPADALNRLQEVSSEVLPILDCGYVSAQQPSLNAALNLSQYQAVIERPRTMVTVLPEAIAVEQKDKQKVFMVKEALSGEVTYSYTDTHTILEFIIRADPRGTLRPDTLTRFILSQNGIDTATPVEIMRVVTFFEDDQGTWHRPLPQ